MLNLDMKIKVSFYSQNPKKVFLSSVNFSNDLRQNVFLFELYPHTGDMCTEILV